MITQVWCAGILYSYIALPTRCARKWIHDRSVRMSKGVEDLSGITKKTIRPRSSTGMHFKGDLDNV